MLSFLYLNDGVLLAIDRELEALALGVAADRFSQDDISRFLSARLFDARWSSEQSDRWYATRSPGDRVAIASVLASPPAGSARLADLLRVRGLL